MKKLLNIMKRIVFFAVSLMLFTACDPNSFVKKQNPTDWLEGQLVLVVNPYNSSDSVLAINVKWGLFPSDMNGREYVLTRDKSPISFMENGKLRDSLFLPIGNREIELNEKEVKKVDGYTIYTHKPDDVYIYGAIVEQQKVYLNSYVSLRNLEDVGDKPYTYQTNLKWGKTVYLFEITIDTDFDGYIARHS